MYQSIIQCLYAESGADSYLIDHSQRVANYSHAFGKVLKLDSSIITQLYYGSLIHDIGKTGIRNDIFLKPGKLTPEEFAEIKKHPLIGCTIVEPIEPLRLFLPIIRHHHERIDGGGYPDGLSGDEIPLPARIVAITDAFDAMTSYRIYRHSTLSVLEAKQQLIDGKGSQFDPVLVDIFVREIIPVLSPDEVHLVQIK